MNTLQTIDWNIAAYSDYRRQELLRAAENERLARQCCRLTLFGRLAGWLRKLDRKTEPCPMIDPVPHRS